MPKQKKTGKQDITKVDSFYSDITKPDTLQAMILRSPAAGKIVQLHTSDLPEGYFFFSAKDIDGQNFITTNGISTPIFAETEASYVGQPLGLVVGENRETVKNLLSQIEIKFEEKASLEALKNISSNFCTDISPNQGGTKINSGNSEEISHIAKELNILPENFAENNDDVEKNSYNCDGISDDKKIVIASRHIKIEREIHSDEKKTRKGDIPAEDETLTEISESCRIKLFAPNWLETDGAFCECKNKNIVIYTRTSCPEKLREDIEKILSAPGTDESAKITVKVTKDHPQNTDGLWRTTTHAAMAAIAASKTEKNIMLALSRNEQINFMPHYPEAQTQIKAAVTTSGKIVSLKIDMKIDCGFTNPYAQDIADRMALAATNIYSFENAEINITAISSDKPPTSLPKKMVDSQIFLGLENLMNKIATQKKLLPTEIRFLHIKDIDFPLSLKKEKAHELFGSLARTSDLFRKHTSFACSGKNRNKQNDCHDHIFDVIPLRGIGFASAFSGSDFLGDMSSYENCNISIKVDKLTELNDTGDEVEAETATLQGFAHSTEIKQQWISRLEKTLHIPKDKIRFEKTEEAESMCAMSHTFDKCLEEAQKARKGNNFFESYPSVFEQKFSDMYVDYKNNFTGNEFSGKPFLSAAIGCAAVELFIDKYTDEIVIKEIHVAIDCGKIISKNVAERTVRLAIQQELSAFVENENTKCRDIYVSLVESDGMPADLGDIVHNMLPSAFCSGLSQALGAQISSLPFSFEKFAKSQQDADRKTIEDRPEAT